MSTAAIAAIEALRDLVKQFLRRADDLAELMDARCGALEDRVARLDRLSDAGGSRRAALLIANRRRTQLQPGRPRLAMIETERNGVSALEWVDRQ